MANLTKFTLLFLTIIALSKAQQSAQDLKETKNICYDGQDPSKWNMKTKLQKFAQGPCSPIVFVPGITGSKLNVEIDCKVLRETDKEAFNTCGWSACPGDRSLFGKKPKSEYRIWIAAPLDPMSIISVTQKTKNCFAALIKTEFDYSTGKMVYKPKPGVLVRPVGASPESNARDNGLCAFDGIQNTLKGLKNDNTPGYKIIREKLENMGYETGLTMQALPYDWRLISGMDGLATGYPAVLKQLRDLTGKKVTIFAHSMGNFRTAHMLWNMSQQEKDDLVHTYIAAAPPFIGANLDLIMLTCGSPDFKFGLGLGLDWKTFKKSVGTFPAVLHLLPYKTYQSQKNQPWMQKILARIAYEKGHSSDPVFSWMPPRTEVCYPNFPSASTCSSGLEVMDVYGTHPDQQTKITNSNFEEFLETFSFFKDINQALKSRDTRHETLPNLGVPMALLYNSRLGTVSEVNYKVDPAQYTSSKQNYCSAENGSFTAGTVGGDNVVPATSAATFGFKMAIEFEEGVPGAKPVKIIDLCSEVNVGTNPFDTTLPSGERVMTSNGYVGLPCVCSESNADNKFCDHNTMPRSPPIMEFVLDTVVTGKRSDLSAENQSKPASYFEDLVKNCRIFNDHAAGVAYEVEERQVVEE